MIKSLRLIGALPLACMIWLPAEPAGAAMFNPSTSRPVAPGDNGVEATLQQVLDGIVSSGSIDAQLGQTRAAVFQPVDASSLATFVISIAGLRESNKFGIYRFGDPDNRVEVFDGVPPTSQKTVEVTFESGNVFVGDEPTWAQTGPDGSFGTAFGLYLEVPGNGFSGQGGGEPYTLFSEDELNPIDENGSVDAGDAAQALIYRGKGQGLLLGSDGTFDSQDLIIAWEDLVRGDCRYHQRRYGRSDGDFQDLVVLVEGVAVAPEPAALIVWSLLAGFAMAVGRRLRHQDPRRQLEPRVG